MLIQLRTANREELLAVDPKLLSTPYGSRLTISSEGLELESRTIDAKNALDSATVVAFVASNLLNIGVGVLTNWIYDRLKDRPIELLIDGRAVRISRADIEMAIQKALDER